MKIHDLFKKFIFKQRIFLPHGWRWCNIDATSLCSYQSWLRHEPERDIYICMKSRGQASFVTKIPVSTLFAMAIAGFTGEFLRYKPRSRCIVRMIDTVERALDSHRASSQAFQPVFHNTARPISSSYSSFSSSNPSPFFFFLLFLTRLYSINKFRKFMKRLWNLENGFVYLFSRLIINSKLNVILNSLNLNFWKFFKKTLIVILILDFSIPVKLQSRITPLTLLHSIKKKEKQIISSSRSNFSNPPYDDEKWVKIVERDPRRPINIAKGCSPPFKGTNRGWNWQRKRERERNNSPSPGHFLQLQRCVPREKSCCSHCPSFQELPLSP